MEQTLLLLLLRMLSGRAFLFYLTEILILALLESTVTFLTLAELGKHKYKYRQRGAFAEVSVDMSEDTIDREQLLAAFSELGVDEVDEAVSLIINSN